MLEVNKKVDSDIDAVKQPERRFTYRILCVAVAALAACCSYLFMTNNKNQTSEVTDCREEITRLKHQNDSLIYDAKRKSDEYNQRLELKVARQDSIINAINKSM